MSLPLPGLRRRALLGAAALAGLTGFDLSLRDGLLNKCLSEMPAALRDDPRVRGAWQGLDAAKVWDTHLHLFGDGDSGSGLWFNPRMNRWWNAQEYLRRKIYINASCIDDRPGRIDLSFAEHLLAQCRAMPPGFKAMLFAFDWARDEAGAPMQQLSTYYAGNDHLAGLAARYPAHFEWVASVHPYDPQALQRMDAAVARGAKAIKWLPSAQNIDPASPRCDPFYARLAALKLPLITHAGDEQAVVGFGEHLGNPLRLRRPLEAGVRVIVAHCASLGHGDEIESQGGSGQPSNFDLFVRLMDEPQYRGVLFGDISAVVQANRVDVIPTLLSRRDWQGRLLNGSDYPLPGVPPLIDLRKLVARGLLAADMLEPLLQLRHHNVLMFDFVLKRSLALDGQRFAGPVFETAPFFAR
ncbi:MAG TPA: amidohydrolase family protein [Rubrivivax sp.]|nr:amidohydrolase family protein [Rubrivivax sp.]